MNKIRKVWQISKSLIRGELTLDYRMLGLKRNRHIRIPKLTNYIRINNLELCAHEILEQKVEGNVAELGVYKGEFAKYLNEVFPNKKLYLFDTFAGFNNQDIKVELENNFSDGDQDFSNTSVNEVISKMKYPKNCIIKQGYFPDSLNGLEDKFSFVSLDADLYKPILEGLEYFYPRLCKGGYIFVHDYNNNEYDGSKNAVREFCARHDIAYTPISDSWGTVIIAK